MKPHELMLTAILDCRRVDLYTEQIILTPSQQKTYDDMLARYETGEPLQYVIGFTEFCGLRMNVNKDVLIPRPETEILVESTKDLVKADEPLRILDLGTGSGCIAIALAKQFPNSKITAVDISSEAIEIAQRNAQYHEVSDRITFVCEDMFNYLVAEAEDEIFDLVVSNPPYIKELDMLNLPADVLQEPFLALEAGEDGLKFYRMIAAGIERVTRANAWVAMELGDGQAEDVSQLFMEKKNFENLNFVNDYVGTKRILQIQRVNSLEVVHG